MNKELLDTSSQNPGKKKASSLCKKARVLNFCNFLSPFLFDARAEIDCGLNHLLDPLEEHNSFSVVSKAWK